jgi:hypothetical protein
MRKSQFRSRPSRPPKLTRATAESLAIEALAYLAGDEARLARFLALSGLGPENVRAAAAEPQFLAGVLDYLACDEAMLLGFAKSAGHSPETLAEARDILSPPAQESF